MNEEKVANDNIHHSQFHRKYSHIFHILSIRNMYVHYLWARLADCCWIVVVSFIVGPKKLKNNMKLHSNMTLTIQMSTSM